MQGIRMMCFSTTVRDAFKNVFAKSVTPLSDAFFKHVFDTLLNYNVIQGASLDEKSTCLQTLSIIGLHCLSTCTLTLHWCTM